MAIVTISRAVYSRGKEVAEKVAERMSYDCISREVLLDASDKFAIPEIKLERAIHDAPSILDRFSHGRQSYIAYIQSELTKRVCGDNVVYHGLAGQFFLRGIDHVLNVCLFANLEDRIAEEIKQKGGTEEDARGLILKDDQERRKWTQTLYGVDLYDPTLYHLVITVGRLSTDDAVELICHTLNTSKFSATSTSKRKMQDLMLASSVKAALIDTFTDISVSCDFGNVVIHTKSSNRQVEKIQEQAKTLSQQLDGINNIEVHAGAHAPKNAV